MKQFFKMIFASCLGVILAGGVLMLLFFIMLSSVISSGVKALESKSDKTVSIEEHSVLEIKPFGDIPDEAKGETSFSFDFLSPEKEKLSLLQIKKALEAAAEEEKIEAVKLDLSQTKIGFGTAQELRWALQRFKEVSGKKVYAFSNIYNNSTYYLASVADKVYLNPQGVLGLQGLASQTLFLSGPLKKLGVEMQVFKVGTFKGAVEPFTRESLSPENRMQIQEYLDGLWQEVKTGIAESRNISPDKIDEFANGGEFFNDPQQTLAYGLVDSLVYTLDLDRCIASKLDAEYTEEDYEGISVSDYLKSAKPSKASKKDTEKIALVIAEGEIKETLSSDIPFQEQTAVINMDIAKKLRKLQDDDDIKAVVMRVNSPGGSAFISEQIWKELKALEEKKPVVVSMGNYAASGGYYISAPATKIIAEPTTLTGSIGIFGLFPNVEGTAKKIDLTQEIVKTSAYADLGNIFKPMRPEERLLIQSRIEKGYELFKSRVAEGRDMSVERVDSIGQGRVWLGQKALELGLVDAIGGLQDAINEAARLAEIEDYELYSPKLEKKEWWEKLLGSWVKIPQLRAKLSLSPTERRFLQELRQLEGRTGLLAMPYEDLTAIR